MVGDNPYFPTFGRIRSFFGDDTRDERYERHGRSWSVSFGSGMLMDPFAPCDPEDPTVEAEVDIGTSVTVGCGMCLSRDEDLSISEPNSVDSLRLQVRWTQIKPGTTTE